MKSFQIFIFLFAVCASPSVAQVLNQQKDSTDLRLAVLECERRIDETLDNQVRIDLMLKKATYLKRLKKFQEAYSLLSGINLNTQSDSIAYQIRLQIATLALLTENVENLHIQLLFLEQNTENVNHLKEFYLLKVLYFNQIKDYSNAYASASEYLKKSNLPSIKRDSLKKLLLKLYTSEQPNLVSEKKMAICSGVLPGSGQMLQAEFAEGFSNMILNGSLLIICAIDVESGLYLNAYVVLFNLFPRFYIAGIKRSSQIAREKNLNKLKKFNRRTLEILSN